VYDIRDSAALTSEEGVTLTISTPKVAFAVQQGQQAMCAFVYSTLTLEIPYTFTGYLYFDTNGGSAYTWSMAGKYTTASYTEMDTVVTISKAGSKAGSTATGAPCILLA
jgi:hypothetical protein